MTEGTQTHATAMRLARNTHEVVGIICNPALYNSVAALLDEPGGPAFLEYLPIAMDGRLPLDRVEIHYDRGEWQTRVEEIRRRSESE